jgi:hypothetical protein
LERLAIYPPEKREILSRRPVSEFPNLNHARPALATMNSTARFHELLTAVHGLIPIVRVPLNTRISFHTPYARVSLDLFYITTTIAQLEALSSATCNSPSAKVRADEPPPLIGLM